MLTAMPAPFNHGDERRQRSSVFETASGGDGPSVLANGDCCCWSLHLANGEDIRSGDTAGMPLLGRTRARAIEAFVARPVVYASLLAISSSAYLPVVLGDVLIDMPILVTVGAGIGFVVLVPYGLLMSLMLQVSKLSQLCVRPGAWYFWGASVMRSAITVF